MGHNIHGGTAWGKLDDRKSTKPALSRGNQNSYRNPEWNIKHNVQHMDE